MTALTGKVGFASPVTERNSSKRRSIGIELAAMLGLALAFIIAATAVSIGVARAQGLGAVAEDSGAPLALAVLLGLLLAGMGGLTALAARERGLSRD